MRSSQPEVKILQKIAGKLKLAIITSLFNDELVKEICQNCITTLLEHGVKKENIELIEVAGSFELPFACQKIAQRQKPSKPQAIIALGVVIKGDTEHYRLIAETCHMGLMQVQLKENLPICAGVLICENYQQAEERVKATKFNKGKEVALATLLQVQIS